MDEIKVKEKREEFESLVQSWNGTNWTEVNDLNTARKRIAGTSTGPAALGFGGQNPSPTSATEEFINPGTILKTLTTT